jgi:hypothetical protein
MDNTLGNQDFIDLSKVYEYGTREQIRKLLNLENHRDFSILHWYHPDLLRPDDASYVLVLEKRQGEAILTVPASYENNKFWYNEPGCIKAIPDACVCGWSYYPFDDRCNFLGEVKG